MRAANTPEKSSFPGCFLCYLDVRLECNKRHDKIMYPQLNADKGQEEIIASNRQSPDTKEEKL